MRLIDTKTAAVMLGKISPRRVRQLAAHNRVIACLINPRKAMWRIEDIERIAEERHKKK